MEQFIEWDTIFTIMCFFGCILQAALLPFYAETLSSQMRWSGKGILLQVIAVAAVFPFFFLQ